MNATSLVDRGRTFAARAVGLGVVIALYGSARQPELTPSERQGLAGTFRFTRFPLLDPAAGAGRSARPVHPGLRHISAWVSSVGAGVALADLDGDGLANDSCSVDPRTDAVVVARVPTQDGKYAPFVLDPTPLPFDASTTAPMGCLPGDLNADGGMDLVVYYWGRRPVLFERKGVEGSPLSASAFAPRELVRPGEGWFSNAATLADVDGDGGLDVVIGNYFADGARILEADAGANAPPEEMQDSMSRAFNGGRNRVLLCRPQPAPRAPCEEALDAFDERTGRGWTLAVGAADLDGDLLPEVYFANDFGPDRLLHNRSTPGRVRFAPLTGTRHLTTPSSKVLGRDSFKGMGVDFGDVDGDGNLDIYVSNIAAPFALEESHFLFLSTGQPHLMKEGRAPFEDRSEPLGLSRSGWAWDAKLADFDNDGRLEAVQAVGFVRGEVDRWPELHELAMGNDTLLRHPRSWPRFQTGDDLSGSLDNAFFVRDSRGVFTDVAAEAGLREPDVTRGIAIADVDGDGDLDLAFANQWAASAFYLNEASLTRRSLVLSLLVPGQPPAAPLPGGPRGPGRNLRARPAVGATAVVHVPAAGPAGGGAAVTTVLVSQVDGGNGHSGKRSHELHFGLGRWPAGRHLHVEIHWRDGQGGRRRTDRWLAPGRHTVVLGTEGR